MNISKFKIKNYLVILFITLLVNSHLFAQQKPKIVTTTSIFADMLSNLVGDLADVESIVATGADPHLHEPTPQDAILVNKADIIFVNGLTLEGWINKLIDNSGTKAPTVLITEGIDVIASQEYQGSADPHAWMVAANGRKYIQNMTNALIEKIPEHKDQILANHTSYDKELQQLEEHITELILDIPMDKRVLITSHDAFTYFGQAYGLQLEPLIGISTEAEVQTSDIQRVQNTIRNKGIQTLFVESTINPKLIKQVAEDNDVHIGGELYADSLGEPGSHGDTYIKMLRHNAETIHAGLTKEYSDNLSEDSSTDSNSLIPYSLLIVLLIGAIGFLFTKMK